MRRTLKEKLDRISMELTTIRLMVTDLHRGLVQVVQQYKREPER